MIRAALSGPNPEVPVSQICQILHSFSEILTLARFFANHFSKKIAKDDYTFILIKYFCFSKVFEKMKFCQTCFEGAPGTFESWPITGARINLGT